MFYIPKQIRLRLTAEEWEKLDDFAKKHRLYLNREISWIIQQALIAYGTGEPICLESEID